MPNQKINHYELNCAIWQFQENPTELNYQQILKIYDPSQYKYKFLRYAHFVDDLDSEINLAITNALYKYKVSDMNCFDKYVWSAITNGLRNKVIEYNTKYRIQKDKLIELDKIILDTDNSLIDIIPAPPNSILDNYNGDKRIIVEFLIDQLHTSYQAYYTYAKKYNNVKPLTNKQFQKIIKELQAEHSLHANS